MKEEIRQLVRDAYIEGWVAGATNPDPSDNPREEATEFFDTVLSKIDEFR